MCEWRSPLAIDLTPSRNCETSILPVWGHVRFDDSYSSFVPPNLTQRVKSVHGLTKCGRKKGRGNKQKNARGIISSRSCRWAGRVIAVIPLFFEASRGDINHCTEDLEALLQPATRTHVRVDCFSAGSRAAICGGHYEDCSTFCLYRNLNAHTTRVRPHEHSS